MQKQFTVSTWNLSHIRKGNVIPPHSSSSWHLHHQRREIWFPESHQRQTTETAEIRYCHYLLQNLRNWTYCTNTKKLTDEGIIFHAHTGFPEEVHKTSPMRQMDKDFWRFTRDDSFPELWVNSAGLSNSDQQIPFTPSITEQRVGQVSPAEVGPHCIPLVVAVSLCTLLPPTVASTLLHSPLWWTEHQVKTVTLISNAGKWNLVYSNFSIHISHTFHLFQV